MALRYVFTVFLWLSFFPLAVVAQKAACVYTLELSDATGQGWGNASVELKIRNHLRNPLNLMEWLSQLIDLLYKR